MSDLFGDHIVGFPTRRLKYLTSEAKPNLDMDDKDRTGANSSVFFFLGGGGSYFVIYFDLCS